MSTSSHLTVADASVKLFQSKEQFWDEKVTQASGFSKILGLISYFWNLRSVTVLNRAYSDLISKVSKQMSQDQDHLPGNAQVSISVKEDAVQNHLKNQSEKALETFYNAFKGRCSTLGVDELKEDFAVYTQAARKALEKPNELKGSNIDTQVRNSKIVKNMKPMLKKFDNIMYKDMVATFAMQKDAKGINMESFAAKSEMMSKVFGSEASDIEASLRKATLDEGKHAEAFKKLAGNFAARGDGSEFEKFKKEVLAQLPSLEKDEARVVLFERENPQAADQTGSIHKSWENLKKLHDAYEVEREKYKGNADAISEITAESDVVKQCESVIDNLAHKVPEFHKAALNYKNAKADHEKLVKEYEALKKATVALRKRMIRENLDAEANAVMNNKAAFYNQMQKAVLLSDVTKNYTGNEKTLFNEMNDLLKNAQIRK